LEEKKNVSNQYLNCGCSVVDRSMISAQLTTEGPVSRRARERERERERERGERERERERDGRRIHRA